MQTEQKKPPLPTIPLLVFAAIDLAIAFVLLVGSGFTPQFWLIAAIGLVLAVIGLLGVYRRPN